MRTTFEIVGLDHVQVAIPVGGEARAREFYGELLGLKEIRKPAALAVRGGAWFQCGAQQLHIGAEQDFRAAKKAHPAFRLEGPDDLAELRDRLITGGFAVRDSNEDVPGVVRFFVDDPFGNRVELTAPAPR